VSFYVQVSVTRRKASPQTLNSGLCQMEIMFGEPNDFIGI